MRPGWEAEHHRLYFTGTVKGRAGIGDRGSGIAALVSPGALIAIDLTVGLAAVWRGGAGWGTGKSASSVLFG
jgi:hypothetical protein